MIDADRILYQSPSCLVLNKIPGEAVEGAGPGMTDLSALAADLFTGPFRPQPVHRLDVPVSGCVLFARNHEALAFLNKALAEGKMEKRYWAILEMPTDPMVLGETGELTHWISESSHKSAAFDAPEPGRKKAVLRYRTAGRGERYLFLEIELITGRRHQIRAQLAALGLHIKGDLKYGARRSEKNGGIRLHARSLSFPAPETPPSEGRLIQASAPPPFQDSLWEAFAECEASPAEPNAPR